MKVYELQNKNRSNAKKRGYYIMNNQTGEIVHEGLTNNRGANALIAILKTRCPNNTFSTWYKM